MNIQKMFSTNERIKILNYIMEDPTETYRVNDVSRKLKLSKGIVSGYFNLLLKQNILKKKGNIFLVNLNPLSRTIKILLNLNEIDIKPVLKLKPKAVGLYGSWAQGTNNKESDIDLWIRFDKTIKQEKIAEAQGKMRDKLKYEVNILCLDPERLEKIKRDKLFFHSLVFGSIILYGEGLET